MKSILIKNGLLVSPINGYERVQKDILIRDGKIAAIDEAIKPLDTDYTADAKGCIVTPGFIDIHTHCYPDTFLGLEPDMLGIERGSTAILDAGSSGSDNYEDFHTRYIERSKTKVFTLLNISKEGLVHGKELDAPEKINIPAIKKIVEKYNDNIVGLKARASASVVGEMGLVPIELAAKTAKELKKPLMVHVGNYPPALTDVLALLGKNDIVTHAYHGKRGGILTEQGDIIQEAIDARNRGVLFDVGHGVASFSFRVFEKALSKGFDSDMISTDLHRENYEGPVYNLAAVASKIIGCGNTLEDTVNKCTSVPAKHFGLKGLGELAIGFTGDINIMEFAPCNEIVADSIGNTMTLTRKLILKKTIYSRGDQSEIFEHGSGK